MAYQCSICAVKVGEDLLVYISHTETHIIEKIKARHPDWVESEGLCQKCLDYYRQELKGVPVTFNKFWTKEQCAARRHAIKNFFNRIARKVSGKN